MIKRKNLFIVLVVALVVSLGCMLCITKSFANAEATNIELVKGEDFVMVDGASFKYSKAGIRFRVKMTEKVKNFICGNENVTLHFIVTNEEIFNKTLSQGKTFGEISTTAYQLCNIDESTIYEDGGSWYANACMIKDGVKDDEYNYNYAVIACINVGGEIKYYADLHQSGSEYKNIATDSEVNINNVIGNLYEIVSQAILSNGDKAGEYLDVLQSQECYSDWFGGEDYPILVTNDAQYEKLLSKLNGPVKSKFTEMEIVVLDTVNKAEEIPTEFSENVHKSYTLTYKVDDDVYKTIIVKEGDDIVTPSINPTKQSDENNYVFAGWEEDTNGTVSSNMTFNAKFDISYNTLSGLVANYYSETYEASGINKYVSLSMSKDSSTVDYSQPNAVNLSWNSFGNGEYVLHISKDEAFSNELTFNTNETSYDVYNLEIGTKYFWKVSQGANTSGTEVFYTDYTRRLIKANGATNARDLGGLVSTVDKTKAIKQGLIYRSAKLDNLTAEGKRVLTEDLGIKTEIDLRTSSEIPAGHTEGMGNGFIGKSVNYYRCDIGYAFYGNNNDQIQKLFEILSDGNNYPIIFHCIQGADRTGYVAFLLEALCDANFTDMYQDYLLTNISKQDLGTSIRGAGTIWSYYDGDGTNNGINKYSGTTLSEKCKNFLTTKKGLDGNKVDAVKAILLGDTANKSAKFTNATKRYTYSVELNGEMVAENVSATAYTVLDFSSQVPQGKTASVFSSPLVSRLDQNGKVYSFETIDYNQIYDFDNYNENDNVKVLFNNKDAIVSNESSSGNGKSVKLDIVDSGHWGRIYFTKITDVVNAYSGDGYSYLKLLMKIESADDNTTASLTFAINSDYTAFGSTNAKKVTLRSTDTAWQAFYVPISDINKNYVDLYINKDCTLYIDEVSLVKTYDITFNNYDNSKLATVTVIEGEMPVYDGTPTKPSTSEYKYEFSGWSPALTVVTDNATYTAQYTELPTEHTVTFDTKGGTSVQSQTVAYGAKANTPAGPTKDGYIFRRWSVDLDNTAITEDITVTAIYDHEDITDKFTFTNNYGVWVSASRTDMYNYFGKKYYYESYKYAMIDVSEYKGMTLKITLPQSTAWGLAFAQDNSKFTTTGSYNTATHVDRTDASMYYTTNTDYYGVLQIPQVDGKLYMATCYYKTVTSQPQFKAEVWDGEEDNYVTYTYLDDENNELGTVKILKGIEPKYDGDTPTKEPTLDYMYTFERWDSVDATTYKAVFTQSDRVYTVSFDTEGGNDINPIEVKYGEKVADVPTPIKSGRTFKRWNIDLANTVITDNIEVFAIWDELDITSRFTWSSANEGIYVDYDNNSSAFGTAYWGNGAYKNSIIDVTRYQGLLLEIMLPATSSNGLAFSTGNDGKVCTTDHNNKQWFMANANGGLSYIRIPVVASGKVYLRTSYRKDGKIKSADSSTTDFSAKLLDSTYDLDITSLFTGDYAVNKLGGIKTTASTEYVIYGNYYDGGEIAKSFARSVKALDISEYQGKKLRITLPNNATYGLVFTPAKDNNNVDALTIKHAAKEQSPNIFTRQEGWYATYTNADSNVKSGVVEIIIPQGAKYLRTSWLKTPGDATFSAIVEI